VEIRTIRPFLDYYEGIRARTRRVIDCIPPDHLEWTHAPGRFTFGDLIRHLAAIERFMFAENVRGLPSRYPGHGRELAEGWVDVIAYFEERHREAMQLFATLTDEDLNRKCTTPGGVAITVWKWLRAMVEHEVHHRGQIYMMLGILGIATPPIYGLTEEQVRGRSIR
jgi:uncharacterized damage-inducible protein DinB